MITASFMKELRFSIFGAGYSWILHYFILSLLSKLDVKSMSHELPTYPLNRVGCTDRLKISSGIIPLLN